MNSVNENVTGCTVMTAQVVKDDRSTLPNFTHGWQYSDNSDYEYLSANVNHQNKMACDVGLDGNMMDTLLDVFSDPTGDSAFFHCDSRESESIKCLPAASTDDGRTVKTERRLIIVRPGVDPDVETERAISQITRELDQKAAEALSAGEVPATETVIEITRVVSSESVVKPLLVVDNFHETGSSSDVQGTNTGETQPGTVSGNSMWSGKVCKRAGVTFRIDEFRTPSPLLPVWDKRSVSGTPTQDCQTSSDDFYFHSSQENSCSPAAAGAPKSCPSLTDLGGILKLPGLESVSRDRADFLRSSSAEANNSLCEAFMPENLSSSEVVEVHSFSDRSTPSIVFTGQDVSGQKEEDANISSSHQSPSSQSTAKSSAQSEKEDYKKRPSYSYMQLIQMAISSSPDLRLTLRQIYQWIETQFPYYKYHSHQGWKNSVRHNLSLYDMFIRIKSSSVAARHNVSYWTLRSGVDINLLRSHCPPSGPQQQQQQHTTHQRESEAASQLNSRTTTTTTTSNGEFMTSSLPSNGNEQNRCQRKGPVPLLPKPSPCMQTITLVPVPSVAATATVAHRYSTVQLVAAKHLSTGLMSSRVHHGGWQSLSSNIGAAGPGGGAIGKKELQSNNVSGLSSSTNQPSTSKLFLKRSAENDASHQTSSVPLKFKVVCRSLNQPSSVTSVTSQTVSAAASKAVYTSRSILSDSVVSGADDDAFQLTASLDTSTLRHQFSNLQFDSQSDAGAKQSSTERAKSASDIVLSRSSFEVATVGDAPKPNRNRRRKQEFNQLLRTPPDDHRKLPPPERSNSSEQHHHSLHSDSGFVTSESGFASSESGTSVNFGSSGYGMFDSATLPSRPHTPPNQILIRSPIRELEIMDRERRYNNNDDVDDQEMNEMLFTPFKTDIVAGMLLDGDLSPDLDLSSSVVGGSDSWVSFTPSSIGPTARTSTPCRLLESTPREEDHRRTLAARHCRVSPRLSRLLYEFDDDGGILGNFGANAMNVCDTSLCDLTSAGVFALDEGVGLDISELDFLPLQ